VTGAVRRGLAERLAVVARARDQAGRDQGTGLATIAELVLIISGNTYREGRKLNLASAYFLLPRLRRPAWRPGVPCVTPGNLWKDCA
jgi:hypothetical protein